MKMEACSSCKMEFHNEELYLGNCIVCWYRIAQARDREIEVIREELKNAKHAYTALRNRTGKT